MRDIIVEDEYIEEIAKKVKSYFTDIDDTLRNYIYIMSSVHEDVIVEGETSRAVESFVDVASKLKEVYEDIGECCGLSLDAFLRQIDSADEYLY